MKKITLLFLVLLTASFGYAQSDSDYCSTEVTHLDIPAEVNSAMNLTIVNTGANTTKITAAAEDIDFLAIIGTPVAGGAATASEADSSVSGEISITLTWADTPPANVTIQHLQWRRTSTGGATWQINGPTTSFDGICGPPAGPEEDTSLSDLQLDGATIADFSSVTTSYTIELADANSIPQVTTVTPTNGSATVGTITQATSVPGSATFDVTSEDTNNVESYTINFIIPSPQTAAPTPPARDAADVVSIYSDAYAAIDPINYDAGWCNGGQPGAVTETTAGGNNVFAYNDKGCQGINFAGDLQDVTGFTNIHVDLFIKAGTDIVGKIFNMKIVPSSGAETTFNIDLNGLDPKPVPGTWFSYDVPVVLSGPTVDIKEFGITSNLQNAVWYDNVYLYKEIVEPTCDDGIQNGDETGVDCGGPDCEPCVVIPPLDLDFETSPITSDFEDFDGAGVTVISNPQGDGNVAQMIRNGGAVWAGSSLVFDNNLDFSTLTGIKMKMWTEAPIGTQILLKTEGGTPSGDRIALTTVTGAWETLTFDFTGVTGDNPKLVFIFNIGNVGDGSAASTYLFDDVEQYVFVANPPTCDDGIQNGDETGVDCGGPDCEPCIIGEAFFLDFETTPVTSDFTDFDGAGVTVMPNPQGDGNVAQMIRNGGAVWAGSFLTFAENPDFSTYTGIKMKMWTEAPVGTQILLKTEGGTPSGDRIALTTVSGAWETLAFDFTGVAGDNPKLVFIFNIGNVGDGSAASTYYFDDVEQFDYSSLGNSNVEVEGLLAYPNPTSNQWVISTNDQVINTIDVYDVLGQKVISLQPNALSADVDASNLPSGVYISIIATDAGTVSKKLIKK